VLKLTVNHLESIDILAKVNTKSQTQKHICTQSSTKEVLLITMNHKPWIH